MNDENQTVDTSNCVDCHKSGKTLEEALKCCAKNWKGVSKPASC